MEFIAGQVYKVKERVSFVVANDAEISTHIILEKNTLLTFISVIVKRSKRDQAKYVHLKKFIYDNQYVHDSANTFDWPHQYFELVSGST